MVLLKKNKCVGGRGLPAKESQTLPKNRLFEEKSGLGKEVKNTMIPV